MEDEFKVNIFFDEEGPTIEERLIEIIKKYQNRTFAIK